MLSPEDDKFLMEFFRAVKDEALAPEDPRYVPLYEQDGLLDDDPVGLLARAIQCLDESVQLLAGFRGIGKSTELRRLKKRLVDAGYKVVIIDVEDYVNQSMPVDITDFLMALAGAFGDAISGPEFLDKDLLKEGYWERAIRFLGTRIELSELSGELGGKAGTGTNIAGQKTDAETSIKLGFKANLKQDPSFKRRLQEQMAGHLGALVADVRKFFEECLEAFKQKFGDNTRIAILVDSIEHIRGISSNALDVQASIERLFAAHADNLKLPGYHVVYTIPPFLKIRYPNLGSLYGVGAVQMFPAIKIKDKADGVATAGRDALKKVIEKRHPRALELLPPGEVERVIAESGGHLRDMLRIMGEIIRRARQVPVKPSVVTSALNQMRSESLPIAESDAVWLSRIAKTHEVALTDREHLDDLAHFFDTNLVLCYRNGPEWYDVHPLIRGHVLKLAADVEDRGAAAKSNG